MTDETTTAFERLLESFTRAVERGDGEALASLFTAHGTYHDGFYGAFCGREAIASMLVDHFWGHARAFRWEMLDPICDGVNGAARYRFTYLSTMPEALDERVVFEGLARFRLRNVEEGEYAIEEYYEVFDRGVALTQLGFPPERVARILSKEVGALRDRQADWIDQITAESGEDG